MVTLSRSPAGVLVVVLLACVVGCCSVGCCCLVVYAFGHSLARRIVPASLPVGYDLEMSQKQYCATTSH
jgi:hypothetical protein